MDWKKEVCKSCGKTPKFWIDYNDAFPLDPISAFAGCNCIQRTVGHGVLMPRQSNENSIEGKIKKSQEEKIKEARPMLEKYFSELISRNGGWNKFWAKKRIREPGEKPKWHTRTKEQVKRFS
jgi:hypothetical protein